MRIKSRRKLPALFAAAAANALESRAVWDYAEEKVFFGRGFLGDSALCGVRPGALPLDSATFEKVDETFIYGLLKA